MFVALVLCFVASSAIKVDMQNESFLFCIVCFYLGCYCSTLLCLLPVVLVKLLCRFSSSSCNFHVDKVTYLSFVLANRCAKMVGTDPSEVAGSSSGHQQVQVSFPFNLLFFCFSAFVFT
jgi:hypothetical protein